MRGSQKNKNYKLEWSSNFAYAVGLITADGSLSKDGRHIILVSKDKGLIDVFKKCLNLKNKIGKRARGKEKVKKYFHVQLSNSRLYKDLLEIGLKPNKSLTLGPLSISKYFFDFLRGFFDGDGSCYSFWDKRWKSSFMFYTVFCSASKKYIKWLRKEINKRLDIRGALDVSGGKRKNCVYQLKYAKKESKILIDKMYYKKNIPSLKRKK